MRNLKHLLYTLSVLEPEEFQAFKQNYNLKGCQDMLAFILYETTENSINEIINEVEFNSPSLKDYSNE